MKIKLMLIILFGIIISIFIIIANIFKLSNANNFKLSNLSLMKNSCTTINSFVISNTGVLYGYGSNEYGQLGDGGTKPTPVTITLADGVSVTQISSGYSHTVAIGSDGELYTWGSNKYGQLGDGTTKISVEKNMNFTQISCGFNYTLALGDDGNLYTWGLNDFGQLGNNEGGYKKYQCIPKSITLEDGIKPLQIACGQGHSLVIGSYSILYTWGQNNSRQLGNNITEPLDNVNEKKPIVISLGIGVKPIQITCGNWYSMAISDDGNLYTWGNDGTGRISFTSNGVKAKPIKTKFDFK